MSNVDVDRQIYTKQWLEKEKKITEKTFVQSDKSIYAYKQTCTKQIFERGEINVI